MVAFGAALPPLLPCLQTRAIYLHQIVSGHGDFQAAFRAKNTHNKVEGHHLSCSVGSWVVVRLLRAVECLDSRSFLGGNHCSPVSTLVRLVRTQYRYIRKSNIFGVTSISWHLQDCCPSTDYAATLGRWVGILRHARFRLRPALLVFADLGLDLEAGSQLNPLGCIHLT